MFRPCRNSLAPAHAIAFGGIFLMMEIMESVINKTANNKEDSIKERAQKGGRPRVTHKKREALSVMCNLLEKKIIQVNARNSGRLVSVFLRELGLNGRVNMKVKSLPKSVLQLIGTLNHTAANLNQIAKKRNRGDDLNPVERALLNQEVRGLQSIVMEIKKHVSWSEK